MLMELLAQQTKDFAYFSKPEYYSILETNSTKELQRYVKKNRGIFEIQEKETNSTILTPTPSQQEVLQFVENYLSGPKEEPLRFLLTGIGGKCLNDYSLLKLLYSLHGFFHFYLFEVLGRQSLLKIYQSLFNWPV